MKVKHLLIKPSHGERFLVLGYTTDIMQPPTEWQLPIIPNEYGDWNLEKVIRSYIKDDYGLKMTKIIDQPTESDLVFVEVESDEVWQPAILIDTDGQDTIEVRRFVNKETLKTYIDSQDSMFGNLFL